VNKELLNYEESRNGDGVYNSIYDGGMKEADI
jgi:hypothetical protein